MKPLRIFLISLIATAFLVAPMTHAQQPGKGSLSISPLIIESQVDPGKSTSREIIVRNGNSATYEVRFEAADVEIENGTHNVQFLPPVSKQNRLKSLASWLVPDGATTFTLSPGKQVIFPFHFVPPEQVASGDYYASLNFYYKPQGEQQTGNISVRQSLGCLLLVSVDGGGQAANAAPYTITPLTLTRKSNDTEVSLRFTNNTLRYAGVKPVITLKDPAGEIYYQKEGASKRIFPSEQAEVLHSFPNTYYAAKQPLTMFYTLWDREGKTKYYEETVPLQASSVPQPFEFSPTLIVLLGVAAFALLGVRVVYKSRKQPRKSKRR